jgi:hypothetical protein
MRMMSSVDLDFEKLISPIDPESFFRDTWERETLVVSRNMSSYYSGLFSMRDVGSMIYFTRPKFTGVRSHKTPAQALQGNFPHDEHLLGENDITSLSSEYARGKTIYVHKLEQRWQPVAALCRKVEASLCHPVNASMFLTPRNSQAVGIHFDAVDGFVLQIEGSKHWRLYKPTIQLPLKEGYEVISHGQYEAVSRAQLGEPIQEVHLKAGDLMYIPRGFLHEAFASDASSLHITLSVSVFRWVDLVRAALACIGDRDVRFRQAVPPGSLGHGNAASALRSQFVELLQHFAANASIEEAVDALSEQFVGEMSVLPGPHFLAAEEVERIDLQTIVHMAEGIVCRVIQEAESVSIQFPGGRIRCPKQVAPALEFISTAGRFPVSALPGGLSDESKLILARRLVRDGLLTAMCENISTNSGESARCLRIGNPE